jgi:subtilisin family serine protease
MKKQYSLDFNKYTPISQGNGYLFNQFDSISSFIKTNFRKDLHGILLKPIKTSNSVDFWSEDRTDYVELDTLSSEKRMLALERYNAFLYEIEKKSKILTVGTGDDDFKWASILRKAFDMDSNIVLSDGESIRLVWGWAFFNKSMYTIPFAEFSYLLDPEEDSAFIDSDELEDSVQAEPSFEETEPNVKETIPSVEPDPIPEITTTEEEIVMEEEVYKPIPPIEPMKAREIVPPTSNGFTQFLDALENFGRKFWWLLLILLILLLLFLIGKCGASQVIQAAEMDPIDLDREYRDFMPDEPRSRIRPIEDDQLIDDEESHNRIVADVVNIALKKKTDNFRHFAVDLKHAFPGNDFEVVYFDDETRRLQFKFPENQRAQIKQEIRSKLNGYKLLLWDEAIFEASKSFNDPSFSEPSKSWPWETIHANQAWDISAGDTSVVVAVIDDGFDLNHFELKNKYIKPYNVVTNSRQITSGPDRKHGTHVAGIIIANGNNGKGMCGVAPGCRFMPIQAAGENGMFSMTDVIDGILYAIKNNADVINMSLGKMFPDGILPNEQQQISDQYGKDEALFWNELFDMAEENKVTIVVAAGNQDIMVGLDPMQRSNKVIKVAATDHEKKKASFSNYFKRNPNNGSCVSAPGLNIFSTTPGNQFEMMSGTSMASPMVAGVVALMKSVNKNLTNKQVMKILNETSFKTNDNKLGPVVQADKAVQRSKRGL